jgi:hypothetical protein
MNDNPETPKLAPDHYAHESEVYPALGKSSLGTPTYKVGNYETYFCAQEGAVVM